MSRTFERQVNELHIRPAILNRFTELGCPQGGGCGVATSGVGEIWPGADLCNNAPVISIFDVGGTAWTRNVAKGSRIGSWLQAKYVTSDEERWKNEPC